MSASLALQGAINTALRAAAPVTALVSTRIYDRVPQDVAFPFVSFSGRQELDDGFSCGESAVEAYITVNIWSRAVGSIEADAISDQIRAMFHGKPVNLTSPWRCVDLAVQSFDSKPEADGLTTHAYIQFRALIDPIT